MKSTLVRKTLFKHWHILLAILILGTAWAIRDISTPYLIKRIVDGSNQLQKEEYLPFVARTMALLFSIWVTMEGFMRLQESLLVYILPRIRKKIASGLLQQVMSFPYAFHTHHLTGSISNKIRSTSVGIERLLSICLNSFTPTLSHLVFAVFIASSVNIAFSIFFVCWIAFHFGLTWVMGKGSLPKTGQLAKARSTLNGKLIDGLYNIFLIKSFCSEAHEQAYLDHYLVDEMQADLNLQRHLEKIRMLLGGSSLLMLLTSLFTSYYLIAHDLLSIGGFSLIIVLLLNLTESLWHLSMEFISFNEEFGNVKESLQTFFVDDPLGPDAKDPRQSSCQIDILNLSHTFDEILFDQLTISIPKGAKIAILGPSGSGKSTLLNLLLGHIPVQSGHILIDGVDIANICPERLRSFFAIAPQHPTLFDRSILENLRYGNPEASLERVYEASKIAHCESFISRLKEGYQTLVGEHGDKLSGGQKQRVAIARALIRNSPVLLLDEPSSSLDQATALEMTANILLHAPPEQTIILITHDPQIASLMDKTVDLQSQALEQIDLPPIFDGVPA